MNDRRPSSLPLLLCALVHSALLTCSGRAADITLAWDPPDPPEDGVLHYTLYIDYGLGARPLEIIPSFAPLRCDVRGLIPGVAYNFHVTAFSVWGESGPSNKVTFGKASVVQDERMSIRRQIPERRPRFQLRDDL